MTRRGIATFAAVAAMLAAVVYATTPGALVDAASVPALPQDIDAYIRSSEQQAAEAHPLIPETAKRIVWRQPGLRTEYAVVYVHGFSATRQETAPLAELVADALGANLFEARLTGHGRAENGLHDVTAEDWIDDTAEALAIGSRLGDKVVVIGTSTGATLALAMAGHEAAADVSHLVLLSPNIRPRNETSRWATRPAGRLIARLFVGPTRSWTPHNELQARYWTTSYPTDAAIELMRLIDFVDMRLDISLDADKELHELQDSLGPSKHILAGDIMAPDSTPRVTRIIIDFIGADGSPELRSAPLSKTSPQNQPSN